MHVIPEVIAFAHLLRVGWVSEGGVEADHAVERPAVDDPIVDLLARRFAFGRPAAGALVRADRAVDHLDGVQVRGPYSFRKNIIPVSYSS